MGLDEVINETAREILKCSPQLYRRYGSAVPVDVEPWATGVLLEVRGSKYLISASHILKESKEDIDPEDIGIMVGNIFHILNGNLKFTIPSDLTANDKIDLAVWWITDADVICSIESKYKFLAASKLDMSSQIVIASEYLVVGFPVTKSKKQWTTKAIQVRPFSFLTMPLPESAYKRMELEPNSHILLDYQKGQIRNLTTGSAVEGPYPEGISGCGVWHLPSLNSSLKSETHGPTDHYLVGIMTDWWRKETAISGTRIIYIVSIIERNFGNV